MARLCDICGKAMKSNEEREFFDLSIMAGDTPVFEGEDVCPDCMALFDKMWESFVGGNGEQPADPAELERKLDEAVSERDAARDEASRLRRRVDELEAGLHDDDIESMSRDELEAEIERRVSEAEKVAPPKPKAELREGVVKSTVFKMPETRGKAQGSLLE